MQLSYNLTVDYPADAVISELNSHLQGRGWHQLREDPLNPGLPTSHVRGWGSFLDATVQPTQVVHQWMADWANDRGDVVMFALRYSFPESAKEDLKSLHVAGILVPSELAHQPLPAPPTAAPVGKQLSSITNQMRSPGEVFLWGQGAADGTKYAFSVSETTLAKTPEWLPEKQDPPLTIPQAVAIAKKEALTGHPTFEGVVLSNVELRPAGSAQSENRWFYCIGLSPVRGGQTSWCDEVTVVVLTDGMVVKPHEGTGRLWPAP